MANQKVSITETELERLKKLPGVKYDLPLNDQTLPSFESLVGKPQTRGWKAGIYIFTHLPTGSKYIGSSNSLSRRLNQYFTYKHINQDNSGKLLPLIKTEGFDKFSLDIFVMPTELSFGFYYLFLEQYHLLNKNFNLNSQRIVNFRVSQGTNIYLYDLEGKTLYYTSKSLNQIKGDLGIHHTTCTNCIKKGNSFLNFFKITNTLIEGAKNSNLKPYDLVHLILEKRKLFLSNFFKEKVSLPIIIQDVKTGDNRDFTSITAAVRYLKSINIKTDRNLITKYLDTGESYKGYLYYKKKS